MLIFALFILPLGLAWLMYSGVVEFNRRPTRNEGHLVVPPVAIDWSRAGRMANGFSPSDLAGLWVVLHPVPETCSVTCLERVTELRQVHRASGRNQERIGIALLLETEPTHSQVETLRNIYPAFHLLWQPEPEFIRSLVETRATAGEVDFYLVDPRGDIMMTYNESDSAAKLSKDLKTLLTWSELDRR